MMNKLALGSRIGIIGAGQLGKMLGQAAQKLGFEVAMYDANPQSCGFNVAHAHTVASFDDEAALLEFVQNVDVVTYEFENINGQLLDQISHQAYLPQGTKLLLLTQERLSEKNWLKELGIPTVAYSALERWEDVLASVDTLGLPGLIKTTRFGYDGKGQIVLRKPEDLQEQRARIETLLAEQPLIYEAFCDFTQEASVIVGRDLAGNIELFPMSINEHVNGILFSSYVAPNATGAIQTQVADIAYKIAEAGDLVGVCGIEFFVLADGNVLVNEIAPRPHNTGHYSLEGCNLSQFDQHILAISGRPLIQPQLFQPSLMINILGQHLSSLDEMEQAFPQTLYHIYMKGEAKVGRKMGHFTLMDESSEKLNEILQDAPILVNWREAFNQ